MNPVNQQGFSLLELIVVMVLLGIMAGGAGLLISKPIEAYSAQLRRARLVDQAEMALRQVAHDVRRALPNSIRIPDPLPAGGWALEMVNTINGARYRDENEAGLVGATSDHILEFSVADSQFNFLGQLQAPNPLTSFPIPFSYNQGERLVIYNTAPANIYNDAASNNNPGIVTPAGTTIALSAPTVYVAGNEFHVTLSTPFQFLQQSPGQRAFIINGPISYICNQNTRSLVRYSNYAYQAAQLSTQADFLALGAGNFTSGIVVSQLASCDLNYQPGSSQRGGLITMDLTLDDATGESINLLHQMHVVNVP